MPSIPVRSVIETAKKVLYTGHIGDGKIFVYDVENVVKVRTGEEGYDALQDVAAHLLRFLFSDCSSKSVIRAGSPYGFHRPVLAMGE